jgi:hypothetical protein
VWNLGELWKCDEGKMDPNKEMNNRLLVKHRNEQFSFGWQQTMFDGESLNWRERNLTLDEFKNICFLDQDMDVGNAFVI